MRRFTNACVRYVERLMPDPFLLALLLTIISVVVVCRRTDRPTQLPPCAVFFCV